MAFTVIVCDVWMIDINKEKLILCKGWNIFEFYYERESVYYYSVPTPRAMVSPISPKDTLGGILKFNEI